LQPSDRLSTATLPRLDQRTARPAPIERIRSGPHEGQQVGVDRLGLRGRHAVWESLVWENATMPSQCALAAPIIPWRHQFSMIACEGSTPGRLTP
jgi:hypothetical protein